MDNLDILLRLFIAHLLADFVLQSNAMAREKKKGPVSWYFRLHIIIVGVSTYGLLGQWTNLMGPLMITILHGGIDATKAYVERKDWASKKQMTLFLIDQALHLATLIGYWLFITGIDKVGQLVYDIVYHVSTNTDILVIVSAYLIVTRPIGILVGFITKKWQEEMKEDLEHIIETQEEGAGEQLEREGQVAKEDSELSIYSSKKSDLSFFKKIKNLIWKNTIKEDDKDKEDKRKKNQKTIPIKQKSHEGLKDAGRTIGMYERALILTFMILGEYQAIGFLIAAKSVFRFGDLIDPSQRKRTEYILIGTLISFTFSILLGISTQFLVKIL